MEEKEKDKDEGLKRVGDTLDATIELSPQEVRELEAHASRLMEENPQRARAIKNLLRTSQTFANSAGAIVDYMLAIDRRDYVYTPVYDAEIDQIRLELQPSAHQRRIQTVAEHLYHQDVSPYIIAQQGLRPIEAVQGHTAGNSPFFQTFARIVERLSKTDITRGFFISARNGNASTLLMSAACLAALRNLGNIAFISGDRSLRSYRNYDDDDESYQRLVDCHLLCIDAAEAMPYGPYILDDFLIPLLKARREAGRITFISSKLPLEDLAAKLQFNATNREKLCYIVQEVCDILPDVVDVKF